jgi:hypothetical protein
MTALDRGESSRAIAPPHANGYKNAGHAGGDDHRTIGE